ncbi:hypothetical protein BGZ98_004191, partial [Dissophora globulifera]
MPSTANLAVTIPINPPGVEPVLTQSQVWAALQRKVRHPSEFVPVISSCQVVSEVDNVVTRVVDFANGRSGIREVCTEHKPSRVEFVMEDGTIIQNVVSLGASSDDGSVDQKNIFLTYAFEWKTPQGVTEGSPQWAEFEANNLK